MAECDGPVSRYFLISAAHAHGHAMPMISWSRHIMVLLMSHVILNSLSFNDIITYFLYGG